MLTRDIVITGDIDFRYGYVFAACNIVAGIGIYFFVIEGQGRTLEEIDTMYLMNVKPWQSSKWTVPPLDQMGEKVRRDIEATNPERKVEVAAPQNGASRPTTANGVNGNKEY